MEALAEEDVVRVESRPSTEALSVRLFALAIAEGRVDETVECLLNGGMVGIDVGEDESMKLVLGDYYLAHDQCAPDVFADLKEFHEVFDHVMNDTPTLPPAETKALRKRLLLEELEETLKAIDEDDMVEVADGIADLVYVAVGVLVSYGIDFDAIWREVHRSNMAKLDPATGKPLRDEGGKTIKPEGWTPPDIAGVLAAQVR